MKKTLVALCVAVYRTRSAADVQPHGPPIRVSAMSTRTLDVAGVANTDTLWRITVREFVSLGPAGWERTLSNGYKVSFVRVWFLESDTGPLIPKQSLRLSAVKLPSAFPAAGTLSFGRLPIFGSVLGAVGLFRAIDPLFR